MHPISLREKSSKLETMDSDISRLLMPGANLNATETEDFIGFCLEVFVACDEQIPVDLAVRLEQVGMELERFFDLCWAAMYEAEIIDRLTIN